MYNFKEYTDEEFFGCKLRGANNVVNAITVMFVALQVVQSYLILKEER